jgi:ribosomal protein S18 acetylase RimI-like enzyme
MAQQGIRIRFAETKDAALLSEISRRTFYDSFSRFNTPTDMDYFLDVQFTREKLMAEVGKQGTTFLLAYLDGDLGGYACLMEREAPSGVPGTAHIEIARLYCEQHVIGKGVGRALMQQCLDTARDKKKDWIWLGVWEKNQRAIDFYTNWGFEKFGEHIFILGHDPQTDWWMKKKLTVTGFAF